MDFSLVDYFTLHLVDISASLDRFDLQKRDFRKEDRIEQWLDHFRKLISTIQDDLVDQNHNASELRFNSLKIDENSSLIDCSICHEEINPNSQATATTSCKHEFHLSCIGSWFNHSGSMECPNCRQNQSGKPGNWEFTKDNNDFSDDQGNNSDLWSTQDSEDITSEDDMEVSDLDEDDSDMGTQGEMSEPYDLEAYHIANPNIESNRFISRFEFYRHPTTNNTHSFNLPRPSMPQLFYDFFDTRPNQYEWGNEALYGSSTSTSSDPPTNEVITISDSPVSNMSSQHPESIYDIPMEDHYHRESTTYPYPMYINPVNYPPNDPNSTPRAWMGRREHFD